MDGRGRVLHMGGGHGDEAGFVKEPGIAQSVHWFRDRDAGLTEALMAALISSELQVKYNILPLDFETSTGISSQMRTKLRDWAVGQARAGCFSQAALSSNDSKTL